jgi:hypothetical protein
MKHVMEFASHRGRGFIENKHSTETEYPPPPPRVCTSIHPEGQSCFDLGGERDSGGGGGVDTGGGYSRGGD